LRETELKRKKEKCLSNDKYSLMPYESALRINIANSVHIFDEVNLLSSPEMVVSGEEALKVAEAINSTTLRMLQLLSIERLDVTTIAKRLGFSEAYISEQVRLLEELKLVNVSYERGKRGIRKICQAAVEKVTLIIKE
jgi:predicted transcriptional regulator